MDLFFATGNQMIFLFLLIVIGFCLSKYGVLPEGTSKILALMENNIFIPALVAGTFISNFTVGKLRSAGMLFGFSFLWMVVLLPLSIYLPKCLVRDQHTRNIFTYGLAFSNFGFMGNSVVLALFPNIFMEYLIFTLPLWILIYVWGVPQLLLPKNEKKGIASALKRFLNPMMIALLVGMIIGVTGISLPSPIISAVDSLGSCMSPVAMILTGVTISRIDLRKVFRDHTIYTVSAVRLILIPLAFLAMFYFWRLDTTVVICSVCAAAMPLGLNTVVIPSAYGKDPTTAAGMALISHLLSCLTIPLIFLLLQRII